MPAFVDIDGYLIGRGDFCLAERCGLGDNLIRISRWVNADECTAWIYYWGRREWSKRPTRVSRKSITCKLLRPGEYLSIIARAPKVK